MSSRKGTSQGSSLGVPPGYYLRRSVRLRAKRQGLKTDEISALPEGIAHRILNFLSTKDAVRTSVLSKKWLATWHSYSVHDFDESRFERYDKVTCRHEFNAALADPLHRGRTHGPPIVEKLRVRSLTEPDPFTCAFIDTYIGIGVNRNKLSEIDLTLDSSYVIHHNQSYPPGSLYNVPDILFTSARFLTTLTLQACEIVPLIKTASMPSLKKLLLKYSSIGDKTLETLISSSLLLEDLNLEFCFGFDNLRVSSPGLKIFKLSTCIELSQVEMDVPSLVEFHFVGSPYQPSHGNIDSADDCTKLTGFKSKKGSLGFQSLEMVTLSNAKMELRAAAEMMSLFRRLVSLTLLRCSFESIPLSFSPHLESVEINSCDYDGLVLESDSLASVRILNHAPPAKHIFSQAVPMGKFTHLKHIVIAGYFIFPGNHFEFTSGPSLETLRIEACVDLTSIRIRSTDLKMLQIINCEELQVVSVDTPKLELLRYFGHATEFAPPVIISNHARVELHLMSPEMFEAKVNYENKLACFFKSFDNAKFIQLSSDNARVRHVFKRTIA